MGGVERILQLKAGMQDGLLRAGWVVCSLGKRSNNYVISDLYLPHACRGARGTMGLPEISPVREPPVSGDNSWGSAYALRAPSWPPGPLAHMCGGPANWSLDL